MLKKYAAAVTQISIPLGGPQVEQTAADALHTLYGFPRATPSDEKGAGLNVFVAGKAWSFDPSPAAAGPWMWVRIAADGSGEIVASEPALLYAVVTLLGDGLTDEQLAAVESGLLLPATFAWQRPLFDHVLTQVSRFARDFDEEAYIERLAASGHTHVEVNALATQIPFEPGVPGEYYPQFYTYCAGLSQFVDSKITRGIYPLEYITTNLQRLKRLAAIGRKYGLKPGICCFEPRTLPEQFFQKYPTLRGARVDHPFRSHLPRYTLAQDHPASRQHYRETVQNLLREVPDLAYMSVWTNDSGAGFEHTASLYVGRNGGPYMIREWRSHDKIAAAAGESAIRYLRLLRESAAEINPDFEVSLRIEPFKVEHEYILKGMGDGVTVESPSLLVRGYHLPYSHPKYPEQESVAGTIYHSDMDPGEGAILNDLRSRGIEPSVHVSASSAFNLETILGVPFPRMLHQKLTSLKGIDISRVNIFGGLMHIEKTPYWPNYEVIRSYQLNPSKGIDDILQDAAEKFAPGNAKQLTHLWDMVEAAVSYIPVVPLYSAFGFVWMRTWVRPLIPNLEAIPKEERTYYERFMVTTPNNPSINDLGKDVLFELISRETGTQMTGYFDENVIPRLDAARTQLESFITEQGDAIQPVFTDLLEKIRALRCWVVTQRNTCAWVQGVYSYLEAESEEEKQKQNTFLQEMIDLDLENTEELLDLWRNAKSELYVVSDHGETSFVWGDNMEELFVKKLELTKKYRHCEPFIDTDILWRLDES